MALQGTTLHPTMYLPHLHWPTIAMNVYVHVDSKNHIASIFNFHIKIDWAHTDCLLCTKWYAQAHHIERI